MSCTASVLADSGRLAAGGPAVRDRGGFPGGSRAHGGGFWSSGWEGCCHRQPGVDGEPAAGTRPGIQGAA